ncbi:MAG TPA: Gfo/Idh/MocA family oxidoreductase, partial [Acidimicrobiales bacterium]|nr:Gfo/Idh/MocA family oxidoreductase [Acidimicrobiales bacterium]
DVDTSAIVATMDDGLLAAISGARHDPLGHDVRVEAYGSLSSLSAGLTERTPLAAANGELPWRLEHPWGGFVERFADAFAAQTHAFVELVAGRRANPCPPAEDVAAMRVAVACDRSRREGRPVQVGAA